MWDNNFASQIFLTERNSFSLLQALIPVSSIDRSLSEGRGCASPIKLGVSSPPELRLENKQCSSKTQLRLRMKGGWEDAENIW